MRREDSEEQVTIRQTDSRDARSLPEPAIETCVEAHGHSFSPADRAADLAKHLTVERSEHILTDDVVLTAETDKQTIGFTQFGSAYGNRGQSVRARKSVACLSDLTRSQIIIGCTPDAH